MAQKYKVQIEEIRKETDDSKSLVLIPIGFADGLFDYLPGQFFILEAEIERPKTMHFDKERKVMIGSDETVRITDRRAFSIVSSPTEEGYVELLVKSERGSFVPHFIEQARAGDTCTLTGPQARFMHSIFKNGEKLIACWSAGSGISSTISLMKFILDKGLDAKIFVFDSNRTIEDIIYYERIKKLVDQSEIFSAVFAITRKTKQLPISDSRVNYLGGRFWAGGENLLKKLAGDAWQSCFNSICGSSSFINGKSRDELGRPVKTGNGIEDYLLESGIPKDKIDKDQFYLQ